MPDELHLKENPSLRDFQDYIAAMVKQRGFDKETLPEIFMLFMEECGELAKAIRKTEKIHSDKNSEQFQVENEAADIFMYLLDICNNLGIDLEKAFRDKEEVNKKRRWEILRDVQESRREIAKGKGKTLKSLKDLR